ncbi:GNAT family N-acetyltransferase [Polaribacter sp. SA4-12]|uniref:GNAT family N-acetyltransferase n=1 Tax=Polaribacter sp. SA4-12 TaxID=1312072 RepID=UPI000B3D1FD6|nr:GNAT family N-acetyltransferase [Polaribacter sp. SA4-12]ARV14376.1 GNAT family N-acetyltransferase [Polaribacter sp. SA4-12]
MIEKLDNKNELVSEEIRAVFQESYKIEAELLNAIDFPPLKRELENYRNSNTDFFGYLKDDKLAGVIEINHNSEYTHIQSLVVNPLNFRQGIASALMNFALSNYNSSLFIVETGVKNEPASNLYRRFGFIETKQWDTNHGVRKVKFELQKN